MSRKEHWWIVHPPQKQSANENFCPYTIMNMYLWNIMYNYLTHILHLKTLNINLKMKSPNYFSLQHLINKHQTKNRRKHFTEHMPN